MDDDRRKLLRRLFVAATELLVTAHGAATAGQSGAIATGRLQNCVHPLLDGLLRCREPVSFSRLIQEFDWTSTPKRASLSGDKRTGWFHGLSRPGNATSGARGSGNAAHRARC